MTETGTGLSPRTGERLTQAAAPADAAGDFFDALERRDTAVREAEPVIAHASQRLRRL